MTPSARQPLAPWLGLELGFWKRHWFLLALVCAVAGALLPALVPSPGAATLNQVGRLGSAFMFFTQGLLLDLATLRRGLFTWKLHVSIQATTFLWFPLLGLLFVQIDWPLPKLWCLGVFFLTCLPSTLSSAVVLTANAGGNVAASAINSALSNTLGLLLTPIWLCAAPTALFNSAFPSTLSGTPAVAEFQLAPSLLQASEWLLLPLALGQLLRPWLTRGASRYRSGILQCDQAIVLFLVFGSIRSATATPELGQLSFVDFAATFALCLLFLGFGVSCATLSARWLGLSRPDTLTSQFCGSHKTLAAGVPMAHILFHNHSGVGVLLLPLLIYHPLQLLIGAWWSEDLHRKAPPDPLAPARTSTSSEPT